MSPQTQRVVDVAVIGAGTAGLAAYRSALAITPSVLLVEGGVRGTTCARVGCMPSKLLLAAAESAHDAGRAALFGVRATAHVDGRAVMDRVRRERDRFVEMVVSGIDRMPPEHRSEGLARFLEPGVLGVGDATVRARAIVVATGSSPVIPPMFAELGDRVVVNDDVFAWEDLPESVAVFGAGVIGLEVGQALHRLGVRARIFGKGSRLGPLTDPVVRHAALDALGAELRIELDSAVQAVRRVGDHVEVDWQDHEGTRRTESFAYALVAAGRRRTSPGSTWSEGASRSTRAGSSPSTGPRLSSDRPTCSSRGTSITRSLSFTRRRTTGALPARMRRCFRTCAGESAGRGSSSSSAIPRWPWRARVSPGSRAGSLTLPSER
jgi:dihydrolipoamide dehydrogenase